MIKFRNSSLWGILFILPIVLLLLGYMVYPLAYNLTISQFDWNGLTPDKKYVGISNYLHLFTDPYFKTILRNFFVFGFFTLFFQAFFGLVLANFLKSKFPFRDIFKAIIFMPAVLSPVIIGNVFFRILDPNIGFLNIFLRSSGLGFLAHSWLSDPSFAIWTCIAINIWQWTGYSMTMYYAGLMAIPNDIYESAKIDGANGLQTFFKLTIPLVRSTTYGLLILGVISSLKQFDLIYTLTRGGPANATQMFSTYIYLVTFNLYKEGYASSIAIVLFIIALVITITQIRLYNRKQYEN